MGRDLYYHVGVWYHPGQNVIEVHPSGISAFEEKDLLPDHGHLFNPDCYLLREKFQRTRAKVYPLTLSKKEKNGSLFKQADALCPLFKIPLRDEPGIN
ncbi:hypothetical protein WSM22_31640 [Cytophagales bacterium WSM2-2]|nr:hypothetical protein WSM22_31640 [Cytophagales bacterium WSM2-2]